MLASCSLYVDCANFTALHISLGLLSLATGVNSLATEASKDTLFLSQKFLVATATLFGCWGKASLYVMASITPYNAHGNYFWLDSLIWLLIGAAFMTANLIQINRKARLCELWSKTVRVWKARFEPMTLQPQRKN